MAVTKASASNIAGNKYVDASAGTSKIGDVPDAPTVGTVTIQYLTATIPFTKSTTGGNPSSYTVTSTPGNKTATGSASPLTIGSLTDATSYTFTVTATNSTGTSVASAASNSATASRPTLSVDWYVAGGGGKGGYNGVTYDSVGGGGGAGAAYTGTNFLPTKSTNYSATIGAGASAWDPGTGGTSNWNGTGASGGSRSNGYATIGGTSGSGFTGGNVYSNGQNVWGGGGGGSTGNGGNAGNGFGGSSGAGKLAPDGNTYATGGGAGGGQTNYGGGGAGAGWGVGNQGSGGSNGGIILKWLTDAGTITIGSGLSGTTTTSGLYTIAYITSGSGNVSWSW